MITVIVGSGAAAQAFLISKPILRHGSPYFENRLKTTFFAEGASGRFELDAQDPVVFGLANGFLHTGPLSSMATRRRMEWF